MEDDNDKTIRIKLRDLANIIASEIPDNAQAVASICARVQELDKAPPPIPKIAPKRWADRTDRTENPGQFIGRVYGDWLGKGLNTGHVRKLDAALWKAYELWSEKGAIDAPDGFHLPTYGELLRQESLSPEVMRQAMAQLRRDQRDRGREKEDLPPVPMVAPELWADRPDRTENPGRFIQRVYGKWIGPDFHSGHVRRLDPSLERAFDRWNAKGSPGAPTGFHLTTKREAIEAEGEPSPEDLRAALHVGRVRSRAYRERTRERE